MLIKMFHILSNKVLPPPPHPISDISWPWKKLVDPVMQEKYVSVSLLKKKIRLSSTLHCSSILQTLTHATHISGYIKVTTLLFPSRSSQAF